MELKDSSFYPIKDVQKFVNWSSKKLQRYAKKNELKKIDGRYLFTGIHIKDIIKINDRQTAMSRQRTGSDDKIMILEASLKAMTLKYEDAKVTIVKKTQYLENEIKILKENIVKQIDLQVQSLEVENEKLKEDNRKLKFELTNEIPHQDKLKKAIQLITLEAMDQGMQHKVFSEEEYQDLIGTITEVDFQKEQVNYLRSRVEKQDEILTKLVNQASERNFIEAKDKGFDKK